MAIKAAVGSSSGTDAFQEASNATKQALDSIQESFADACIVFASASYDQQKVLHGVRSAAGDKCVIVGCSSAGEITTLGVSNKPSIVVMALRSNTVVFYGTVGERVKNGPAHAGMEAARSMVQAMGEVSMLMMFTDVLSGSGGEVIAGALQVVGEKCPIIGGAAADDFAFEKTYQYLNEVAYTGAVVALGIKGPIKLGVGVRHGWIPIGVPSIVTSAEGTVVHTINNRPAIEMYKEYFGEVAKELETEKLARLAITYPLGIAVSGYDEMFIRDPLTVLPSGAINFAAEIPVGSEIQLMIGSENEAIEAAGVAGKDAKSNLGWNKTRAAFIFNCVARKKLLGERVEEEIRVVKKEIGEDVPLLGFYTYGELSPVIYKGGLLKRPEPAFHNETIVVCLIGE